MSSLALGSSPRMRGALCGHLVERRLVGIIPADAGSTPSRGRNASPTQDHPRGCGEHGLYAHGAERIEGSSPRMRGALWICRSLVFLVGIIPADAGSTWDGHHDGSLSEDHPRGCGEHLNLDRSSWSSRGSSPRMRGAPEMKFSDLSGNRIIPADAGSTGGYKAGMTPDKDHPRGCGEHSPQVHIRRRIKGSSPRMRGARLISVGIGISGRIIPADAGSTQHRQK